MIWFLFTIVVGCMGPDDFREDHNAATCTLLSDCELLDQYGWSSTDKCESGTEALPEECEAINRDEAKSCVTGIEQMDCADLLANAFPATCEAVCAE